MRAEGSLGAFFGSQYAAYSKDLSRISTEQRFIVGIVDEGFRADAALYRETETETDSVTKNAGSRPLSYIPARLPWDAMGYLPLVDGDKEHHAQALRHHNFISHRLIVNADYSPGCVPLNQNRPSHIDLFHCAMIVLISVALPQNIIHFVCLLYSPLAPISLVKWEDPSLRGLQENAFCCWLFRNLVPTHIYLLTMNLSGLESRQRAEKVSG